MDMACSFFIQHAAHERAIDEADALDAADEAEAERKRINFTAYLRTGDKLGGPMFATLADLASDFTGYSPHADQFLTAACRALYVQAQAGDAEAQTAIANLEAYFLER